jgi:hypothetical protein
MDRPGPGLEPGGSLGEILEHYGVKGMKWGVRRRSTTPTAVAVTTRPGKRVKTAGGKGQSASEDAVTAAVARQKAKKSTVDSLSNKELQNLVARMNLEQQYSRLAPVTPGRAATKFLGELLIGVGKQEATKLASDFAGQQVKSALKK